MMTASVVDVDVVGVRGLEAMAAPSESYRCGLSAHSFERTPSSITCSFDTTNMASSAAKRLSLRLVGLGTGYGECGLPVYWYWTGAGGGAPEAQLYHGGVRNAL